MECSIWFIRPTLGLVGPKARWVLADDDDGGGFPLRDHSNMCCLLEGLEGHTYYSRFCRPRPGEQVPTVKGESIGTVAWRVLWSAGLVHPGGRTEHGKSVGAQQSTKDRARTELEP